MDSGLLKKLFGSTPTWHGPCVVFVDADTSVKASGQDSIVAGGTKSYAPRISSGRVNADAVCYHADSNALLVVQRTRTRQSTGEDVLQQTLMVFDVNHVVGVEFDNLERLNRLDLKPPPVPDKPHYTAGMLVG
jgi:hypothetical protein